MKQVVFYPKSAQPNESHNSSFVLDAGAIDANLTNLGANNVSDNLSFGLLDQCNISAIEPLNEDLSVARFSRKRKLASYIIDNGSDLSDNDDDTSYIPPADECADESDSENPYVPKKIRYDTSAVSNFSDTSGNIIQSTPKRKPGRPKGSKNKHSKKNKSCHKSESTWDSSSHVKLGKKCADKNVKVSKVVKQPENLDFDDKENSYPSDEVIFQFRENSSQSATGCNSPVKKKSPKKNEKNCTQSTVVAKKYKKICKKQWTDISLS